MYCQAAARPQPNVSVACSSETFDLIELFPRSIEIIDDVWIRGVR